MRNVLISKSKMRTVPKSGYTRRMKNYCPVWSLEKTMMTEWNPFRRMSRYTNTKLDVFNTPIVSDESQGGPYTYQPFATKVKDSKLQPDCFQLLTEEDCHYERNAILFGTMWSNILSTSVNTNPLFNYWAALDTGQSTLQLISFPLINWSRWPNLLPFYNSQWAINSAE